MRYARWLAASMTVLVCAGDSRAQLPIAPFPGAAIGGRSFGITYSGKRISASLFFGGYGPGCFGPGYCGPCVSPFPYYSGPRVTSVAIYSPPPVIAPPPVFFNNPVPPALAPPQDNDFGLLDPIVIRPRQRAGQPMPEDAPPDGRPLPGNPAGGFRPVRPEDRMHAQAPAPDEPPPPKMPPFRDRVPRAAEPDRPAKEEAARQMMFGKQAYAVQEYGRAAARFTEATRLNPEDAAGHFLQGQACFALGKYREAVAAIHTGLLRQPNWPASDFRPIELYGANVADYTAHLEQLREALDRNPRDPVLLFLYAYQLWFDGRQDEARTFFRRALPLVMEPRFIQLFLDAGQGLRVV